MPNNEPLLGILDRFQEGRSHMAIVSRFSVEQAVSVKKAVKRGLTRRLLDKVGMGDSSDSGSSTESDSEDEHPERRQRRRKPLSRKSTVESDNAETLRDEGETDAEGHTSSGPGGAGDDAQRKKRTRFKLGRKKKKAADIEMAVHERQESIPDAVNQRSPKVRMGNLALPRWEQSMPADAVLTKQCADEVRR